MIATMVCPFTGQEIATVPTETLIAFLNHVGRKVESGRTYREHQAATIAEVRRVLAERTREGPKPKGAE